MNFARSTKEERRVLFGQNNFSEFFGHTYFDEFACLLTSHLALQGCLAYKIAEVSVIDCISCPVLSVYVQVVAQQSSKHDKFLKNMFLLSFLLLTYHLVWFHFRGFVSQHVCNVAFGMYSLLAIPFPKYGHKTNKTSCFEHISTQFVLCTLQTHLRCFRNLSSTWGLNPWYQSAIIFLKIMFRKKKNFYSTMFLFCSSSWSNPLNWSDCVFARLLRQHSTKSLN